MLAWDGKRDACSGNLIAGQSGKAANSRMI